VPVADEPAYHAYEYGVTPLEVETVKDPFV
jgi:hypothetical protein